MAGCRQLEEWRQERVPRPSSKRSWFWFGAGGFGEDGGEVVEGVGEAEGELQQRPEPGGFGLGAVNADQARMVEQLGPSYDY